MPRSDHHLAIETSGTVGGIALGPLDAPVPHERRWTTRGRHGEVLAPAVRELLAEAGLSVPGLAGIVVGIGPGSFTGLRIGMTFAKTLALFSYRPLRGVSELAARAAGAHAERPLERHRFLVAERAHASGFHLAEGRLEAEGPRLLGLPELAAEGDLPAPAVDRILLSDDEELLERWRSVGAPTRRLEEGVRPADLLRAAGGAVARGESPDDPRGLEPLYLQPAAAERP